MHDGSLGHLPYSIITTGVTGLDEVLGGGLVSGGIYLVEGRAGSGKTILGSQIAFHQAAGGNQVLYVTVLAESHGKLLNHLRRFSFYDEQQISLSIQVLSGYAALKGGGLSGLLRALLEFVRQYSPRVMVIDGIRIVFRDANEREASEFVHELDALASGANCTTLLLSPMCGNDERPEHTLVDGVIELSVQPSGLRRGRLLEVRKLRGAAHLTGQHLVLIDDAGIRVFPRLEARRATQAAQPREIPGRSAFGIATLDERIDGGLLPASTTAILGAPGVGKTLLGLSFLQEGLRRGEPAEYFGFYESPERLVAKAARVGLPLQQSIDRGLLNLQWQPPLELFLDELADRLLRRLDTSGSRRLFVDGLDGFRDSAAFPERVQTFLTALTVRLRAMGVTTLFSEELPLFPNTVAPTLVRLSPTIENIILLRQIEVDSRQCRLLSVLKMRENTYDSSIREFSITETGIIVGAPFRRADEKATPHGPSSAEPRQTGE